MWYRNWALKINGIPVWLRYPDHPPWQGGHLMMFDRVQGYWDFGHAVDYHTLFHTN